MASLVVDAANVVGARPNGWWRDRGKAARQLHQQLLTADLAYDQVILVLEGQAKSGARPGRDGHVEVVHAPTDGDSEIVRRVEKLATKPGGVSVVTADRELQARVSAYAAATLSPSWLWSMLDPHSR